MSEPMILSKESLSVIYTPENIAEETHVSGFIFSNRLSEKIGLKNMAISPTFFESPKMFEHAELVKKIASDCAGGATVGENSITIWIDTDHENSSSKADYIWMYFGRTKSVKLVSSSGQFLAGFSYKWDLNNVGDWLEDNVNTDLWDEISLVNDSTDGIKIERIQIKHSSQIILDWKCSLWLDQSNLQEYTKLVLTAKILETKLNQVNGQWVPQIHWAAREIGKTDGTKYGSTGAWCSEFASWCLRKALWNTPDGNIGVTSMESYFSGLDRKYTKKQLLNGEYQLKAGDYVCFKWSDGGHHSAIFIEYIDDPSKPTEQTTIQTIEGNASSTIKLAKRDFKNIQSVGNCR